MSGRHWLVTGGLGFIGSAFVRQALRERRDVSITVLDVMTYAANPENVAEVAGDPRYRFVQGWYAVTGIYMFDNRVFDHARDLKRYKRGELEITDVNNAYIAAGDCYFDELSGWWTDAGQFESLYRATQLVAEARLKKAFAPA